MNKQTYINATDARKNFFDLLLMVKNNPFPVNITVKGVPEAVIMSREEYDSWMATIETLSDPEEMAQIRESEADFKAGRYSDWRDVKKELGLDKKMIIADKSKKKYVSSQTKQPRKKRS